MRKIEASWSDVEGYVSAGDVDSRKGLHGEIGQGEKLAENN